MKVHALHFVVFFVLRRIPAVPGSFKAIRALESPLCGHVYCDQNEDTVHGGSSLLFVFSALSELCGVYGPSPKHEDGRSMALEANLKTAKKTPYFDSKDTSL